MISSPTCSICLNEFDPNSSPFSQAPQFSCNHLENSICTPCADQWFQINLAKVNYKHEADGFVKCPMENCDTLISLKDLFSMISLVNFPKSEEQLFQNYLKQPYDIIKCPNQSCQYYGFHPGVSCQNELICELCNFQWKEPENNAKDKGIFSILFSSDSSERKNQLYKFFHTKKCPTCLVPIEKNGGSETVICTRCESKFCWQCLRTITFKKQHPLSCNMKVISKGIIFIFLPIVYIFKIMGFFEFLFSIQFISPVTHWYDYLLYEIKLFGLIIKAGIYYAIIFSTGTTIIAGSRLIATQILASRNRTEMIAQLNDAINENDDNNNNEIQMNNPAEDPQIIQENQILNTQKQIIFFSGMISAGLGVICYLFGSKQEIQAFLGLNLLGVFFILAIYIAIKI